MSVWAESNGWVPLVCYRARGEVQRRSEDQPLWVFAVVCGGHDWFLLEVKCSGRPSLLSFSLVLSLIVMATWDEFMIFYSSRSKSQFLAKCSPQRYLLYFKSIILSDSAGCFGFSWLCGVQNNEVRQTVHHFYVSFFQPWQSEQPWNESRWYSWS